MEGVKKLVALRHFSFDISGYDKVTPGGMMTLSENLVSSLQSLRLGFERYQS